MKQKFLHMLFIVQYLVEKDNMFLTNAATPLSWVTTNYL